MVWGHTWHAPVTRKVLSSSAAGPLRHLVCGRAGSGVAGVVVGVVEGVVVRTHVQVRGVFGDRLFSATYLLVS